MKALTSLFLISALCACAALAEETNPASTGTPDSGGADIVGKLAKKFDKLAKKYPQAGCGKLPKVSKTVEKGEKELVYVQAVCSADGSSGAADSGKGSKAKTGYTGSSVSKLKQSFASLKSAHDKKKPDLEKQCSGEVQKVDGSILKFQEKLQQLACT